MANLLVWILVGLIAGWLAGRVMTGRGFGLLMDIVVGMLGAFLGGFLAGLVGISAVGILAQILVAFAGAVILLMMLRLLGAGRRRPSL